VEALHDSRVGQHRLICNGGGITVRRKGAAKCRNVPKNFGAKTESKKQGATQPAHRPARGLKARGIVALLAAFVVSLAALGSALSFPTRGGITHDYPAIHASNGSQAHAPSSLQASTAASQTPRTSNTTSNAAGLHSRSSTFSKASGTHAELLSTDNQDVGFTGYIKDPETGLYYAKARYYDPRVGRFITQDPEEGKPMQPPSLHRYLYAYANPTVYTDPSGRDHITYEQLQRLRLMAERDPSRAENLRQQIHTEDIRIDARAAATTAEFRSDAVGLYQLGKNIAKAGYEASVVGYASGAGTEGIDTLASGGSRAVNSIAHPIDNIYTPIHNKYVQAAALDEQGQTYKGEYVRQDATIATASVVVTVASLPSAVRSFVQGTGKALRQIGAADARVVVEGASGDVAVTDAATPSVVPDYGSGRGRRGNRETREHIDAERDRFLDANPDYEHVAGGTERATGRKLPEEYIPGPGGGRKGSSYPDLTFEAPDGSRIRINTVDADQGGVMTTREQANFDRIFEQTGEPIIAVPKPTPIEQKLPCATQDCNGR
jgi:RHS repeat-associated protein